MKKIFTFLIALLLLAGNSYAVIVTIGTETSSQRQPFGMYWGFERSASIYTAAEMTTFGTISTISWYVATSQTTNCPTKIYLKTTTATTLTADTWANMTTGATLVYDATRNFSTTGWVTIDVTDFNYNSNNLLVLCETNYTGGGTTSYPYFRYTTTSTSQHEYWSQDNSAPTGTGTTNTYRPNIQFNILTTDPTLMATPNTLAFGYIPFGSSSAQQSYVLEGLNLTAGPIVVTAPAGFGISLTSGGPYTSTVNVTYTPPTFTQTIYARFTPNAPNTTYSANITHVGGGANMNLAVTGTSDLFNSYCTSVATYTGDEEIFNVTVGGINNTSDCSTLAPGPGSINQRYSNYYYAVTPASMGKGSTQNFSVQVGTCGGNYSNAVKIFIDYNQNGLLTDAGEEVYVSPTSTSGAHTETGSFVVPLTATPGYTLMRVVNVETSLPSSILPCGTYGWGETEDYKVAIAAAPDVTTTAATSVGATLATLNANVSANFATTTVTFEYGTMATPPFDHTIVFPMPVTDQNSTVSWVENGLQPNTTYYFRALGTNSIGSANGSILSFTTTMVPPAITTNDATIVGATFATLNGNGNAFNANTTVSFEYGQTMGGPYPSTTPATPGTLSGHTPTNFSATVTGLVINTNYYYRAKGVNAAGTTYGLEKTFYTTCVVPPNPGAISGPTGVCKNGTDYVYSLAMVPYGFIYEWIFPAGFTITSFPNSNEVTVSVSGTAVSGTVSVRAVSDCGAPSAYSTKAVTVNNLPVPTVSGNSPVCQYVSNAYSTQAGNSTYIWNVSPDGTITPTSNPEVINVVWNADGPKTVNVIYTNPATGCTAATPGTKAVTVNASPVPTITGPTNMCVNSGYFNYSTETGKTNYIWTVSSGGSITGGQGTSQIEVTWNTPGAKTVTVNYSDVNTCSAPQPAVYDVAVDGIPGAAGSISGPSNVCYGSTGSVYAVATIANAAYYVWSLPAGASIVAGEGTNTITVDYTLTAVSGNITVYGNSLCGNGSLSPAFPIVVNQVPGPAGMITGPTSVCEGSVSVEYSVATIPGATEYEWTLPAGAIIIGGAHTANITVIFPVGASSGNLSVLGRNLCGDGTASPDLLLTVFPTPDAPEITVNGDLLTSNTAEGNQWYYNGAMIFGATGQTQLAQYSGWYWDVVTKNGCDSDTSNNIYVIVTGMPEHSASNILISPVPNNGSFNTTILSSVEQTFDIMVYNQLGVLIFESQDNRVKGRFEKNIDLRPLPSGIYTIIFQSAEQRVTRKIIINN